MTPTALNTKNNNYNNNLYKTAFLLFISIDSYCVERSVTLCKTETTCIYVQAERNTRLGCRNDGKLSGPRKGLIVVYVE